VAGSPGAELAPGLEIPNGLAIVSKATEAWRDAYSGFERTELGSTLQRLGATRLFVGGLATDYCVLNTVLDGLKLGFEVLVLEDAVRAVNLAPEDGARALEAMRRAGARLITLGGLA
jgi:nicotinamidase/pyrazinamidase